MNRFVFVFLFCFLFISTVNLVSATVTWDGSKIVIEDNIENLTTVNQTMDNTSRLEQLASKEWLLKVPIQIQSTGTFYINDSDCDYLKMKSMNTTSDAGITTYGVLDIADTKITSWNTTSGGCAETNVTYRSYLLAIDGGALNISDSNCSYLGAGDGNDCGIRWQNSSANPTVVNSTFYELDRGLFFEDVESPWVENNTIGWTLYRGINMGDGLTSNATIKDNILEGCESGILLRPGRGGNNTIIGNTVNNAGWSGIGIGGTDDGSVIAMNDLVENNTVYNAYHNGIDVYGFCQYATVNNNTVTWTQDNGIYMHVNKQTHHITVTNNTVTYTANRGINTYRPDYCVIKNNNISHGFGYAIQLLNSNYTTVQDNYINNNSGYGVQMNNASHTIVVNNTVINTVGTYEDYMIREQTLYSVNNTIKDIPAGLTNDFRVYAGNEGKIWFTDGKIFNVSGGDADAIQYLPNGSVMNIGPDNQDTTISIFNMSVVPVTNSSSVTINVFDTSLSKGETLIDIDVNTTDGDNVDFTVGGLTVGAYYQVKKNGTNLTTEQANSSGCIEFSNSEWSITSFTVTEVDAENVWIVGVDGDNWDSNSTVFQTTENDDNEIEILQQVNGTNNKDTNLKSAANNETNYGSAENIEIETDGSTYYRRGIINFTLPDGSGAINSVKVYLWDYSGSGISRTLDIHELNKSFVESEATWEINETGSDWDAPGGDYDPAVVDHFGPFSWDPDSSPQYVNFTIMGDDADNALSLDWGDSVDLLIKQSNEGISIIDKLRTKEYSSNRPYLEVSTGFTNGNITSIIKDASSSYVWSNISYNGTNAQSTNVSIYVNTSSDNLTWGGWQLVQASANGSGVKYDISSDDQGRYTMWRLVLQGNSTASPKIENVTLYSMSAGATTPSISSESPTSPVSNTTADSTVTFSATINQSNSNNHWWADYGAGNVSLEWDNSTASPSYTNTTFNLSTGNNTYTIYLETQNSSDNSLNNSTSWTWYVNDTTKMPPTPTTLANTTGNFWVNHTWAAGSGNVTDSYNVSINGTWYNGTTNLYNNTTLSAHAWANASIYAFNSSGRTSLNLTNISQNTQIPNNAPSLSGLPDNTTTEDTNITDIFDLDDYFTDVDSDTPTYDVESNNQSANVNVTIDGENRIDYILDQNWNGVAEIIINVTDGYEGEDNDTFLIIVTSVNDAPIITAMSNIVAYSGDTVSIDVNATDAEGDTLTYSCNRTDLFTNFNTTDGTATWTANPVGTYGIDFGVSDGTNTDNETISITVNQQEGGASTGGGGPPSTSTSSPTVETVSVSPNNLSETVYFNALGNKTELWMWGLAISDNVESCNVTKPFSCEISNDIVKLTLMIGNPKNFSTDYDGVLVVYNNDKSASDNAIININVINLVSWIDLPMVIAVNDTSLVTDYIFETEEDAIDIIVGVKWWFVCVSIIILLTLIVYGLCKR